MGVIVQKYGGTSVGDIIRIKNVAKKIIKTYEKGNKVAVVVSAMGGTTDELIAMTQQITDSPDKREMDVLLSTGEQVTIALLTMCLQSMGYKATSLLGHQAQVKTDCKSGSARILNVGKDKVTTLLDEGNIVVIAGFQGVDENGNITTLGRGGSDTSAVAIAAAIDADVCEIYTDVSGIYTTDPNICEKARKMDKVSYDEMLEMASLGAKVLQIRSVEFAKKYQVPLHVRSSFNDEEGTMVVNDDTDMEKVLVSGVTYNKNEARITLRNVPDEPGIAAKILTPISNAGILVDMIIQNTRSSGLTDFTFTVPKTDFKEATELSKKIADSIGATEVLGDPNISKVSVIGVGMKSHSGVASKMFEALSAENINIRMISTSEIRISCIVEEKYTELAIRALHTAFDLDIEE